MLGYEGKRSLRRIGPIIDKINIVLGVCIILCGIFLIVNVKKYDFMFPVIFQLGAIMNILLAFKSHKMADNGRMVVLAIGAVLLIVLSIIAFMVTLS